MAKRRTFGSPVFEALAAPVVGFTQDRRRKEDIERGIELEQNARLSNAIGSAGGSIGDAISTGALENFRQRGAESLAEIRNKGDIARALQVGEDAMERTLVREIGATSDAVRAHQEKFAFPTFGDAVQDLAARREWEVLDRRMRAQGKVPVVPPEAQAERDRLENEVISLSTAVTRGQLSPEAGLAEMDRLQARIDSVAKPIYVTPPQPQPTTEEAWKTNSFEVAPGKSVVRDVRNGAASWKLIDYSDDKGASDADKQRAKDIEDARKELERESAAKRKAAPTPQDIANRALEMERRRRGAEIAAQGGTITGAEATQIFGSPTNLPKNVKVDLTSDDDVPDSEAAKALPKATSVIRGLADQFGPVTDWPVEAKRQAAPHVIEVIQFYRKRYPDGKVPPEVARELQSLRVILQTQ